MRRWIPVALVSMAMPAQAEVLGASNHGFEIQHSATLDVPPQEALTRFEAIGGWWSPDHTYSGKAESLSLSLKPGGCFCEALPNGGGVEHMRVVYVEPGKRAVLTGALGPLLFEAANGVLDVRVDPLPSGTRMTFNYRAAGFARGGADKIAPAVDKVLGEQVSRLSRLSRERP